MTSNEMPALESFYCGAWQPGGNPVPVYDKFSRRAVAEVLEPDASSIDRAVSALADGFERDSLTPVQRASILRSAAELVARNDERFICLMVVEAGFIRDDARTEVMRAIVTLNLCAEEATRLAGEMIPVQSSAGHHERIAFTLRMPIGVVCAITPFNSPLNTLCHKVGPAIAAGNTVVLKPSNYTPLSASLLVELLLQAGLPETHIALLQGEGSTVGQALLEHKHIQFYAFTGSTEVGRKVREGAGLRRCQLELGSIASTILCGDANLGKAVPKIAAAAFRKAGQVCTSVQRVYVQKDRHDDVLDLLTEAVRTLPAGDPSRPDTRVGPMISQDAAMRAEAWIGEAAAAGAQVGIGGRREGSVLDPTILYDVRRGMKVVDREAFAPLLCLIPFEQLSDALRDANDTPYGLGAGIFTQDIDTALRAARKLRFGSVHINETSSARADAMPFGGVKGSGFGREGPRYACREMTEERLITLNL